MAAEGHRRCDGDAGKEGGGRVMQGQIACDHLRTGSITGRHKCRLNWKPTNCVGLHSRCECSTLRQSHDRWMPTVAAYKVEVTE